MRLCIFWACRSEVYVEEGPLDSMSSAVIRALALVLLGLSALLAGCGTFSSRLVLDPGPAVGRLRHGSSPREEVDRLARPFIQSGEVYGMAVGVLTPDGATMTSGYGRTGRLGERDLPRGDTIFQIGSVSKLFVAALLAQLVADGTLSYDDTVRGILPAGVPLGDEIGKVSLLELVTNTGGLPRQPYCLRQLKDFTAFLFTGRNLYAYIDKPFLYRYLHETDVRPREKRQYAYSNIGYGLLAHLIEVKTGYGIEELLQGRICRPLGLRDTTFFLNAEQKGRLAVGHAGIQPRFLRRGHPIQPWDMGEIMRPSGCLYSTVDDLLIFARANLGVLHHPLEPVLASTHVARLSQPGEEICAGWLIEDLRDYGLKVTYKQGVVAGYSGYIGLEPRTHVAVVVLYNTFSWDDKIGHNLILRLSRGLSPPGAAASR